MPEKKKNPIHYYNNRMWLKHKLNARVWVSHRVEPLSVRWWRSNKTKNTQHIDMEKML